MSTQSSSSQTDTRINFDFRSLQELRRHERYCDLYIQPTGEDCKKIFACHKVVLAATSPFFKEELDRKDDPIFYVDLVDEETLESLIDYMYTGGEISLTEENVFKLCPGAQKLKLQELELKCIQYITSLISVTKAVQIFLFARFQRYEHLTKICLNFILENLQEVKHYGFFQLDSENVKLIALHQIHDRLLPPEDMLQTVIEWLHVDVMEREQHAFDLIKDFPLTSIHLKVLKKFLREDAILRNNPLVFSLYVDTVEEIGLRTQGVQLPQVQTEEKSRPKVISSNFEVGQNKDLSIPEAAAPSEPDEPIHLPSNPSPTTLTVQLPLNDSSLQGDGTHVNSKQLEKADREKRKSPVLSNADEGEDELESEISDSTNESRSLKRACMENIHRTAITSREPLLSPSKSIDSGIEPDVVSNSCKARKALTYFVATERVIASKYVKYIVSLDLQSKELERLRTYPEYRKSYNLIYHNEKIYSLGGVEVRNLTEYNFVKIFDVETKTWDGNWPNHVEAREGFSSIVLGDYLYAIGGNVRATGNNYSKCVERLNLLGGSKEKWKEVACTSFAHVNPGICVLNGCIYLLGGSIWNHSAGIVQTMSATMECYDPNGNVWTTKCSMPCGREGHAVLAAGKYVYVLGGHASNPSTGNQECVNTVDIYDPRADRWRCGVPMIKKRTSFAAVEFNKCIYAIGGDSDESPTMEKFNIETQLWEDMGQLPINGFYQTAALSIEEL